MFFLLRRYLNLLLVVMTVGGLAACTSTDTGSRAVIEDSSFESAVVEGDAGEAAAAAADEPMQFDETAPSTSELESQEMGASPDDALTSSAQQAEAVDGVEEFPIQSDDIDTAGDGAITGSAQSDGIQGVEEFPIQRYEIDEPREIAAAPQTDAEIERLRQELAATESELERIRAEEQQRDYTVSEPISMIDSSPDESASSPQQATTTAQVSEQPAPARGSSDLPGMPSEKSIYFGYDEATFDQQYESVLLAHAQFLKANPGIRVEIQGNCDERGSREYNIALGQRRALAVKRALELLGVDGYRIETVSFGAEKPVAFGHDEASWRLNRRADIVY